MEKVLIVCKPSGKDAFGSVMYFLGLVAGSIYLVIKGFSNPYQWLWLLLTLPASALFFFLVRYEFLGEERIGVDGYDLVVKHANGLPFGRGMRIPLLKIKEIGIPKKSKLDEFFEILDELNMYPVDESSLEIVTIDGKTYHFGDDLSPQEVEYFTRKLIEEIAKLKN
jgi:translation elongation factor P/translation initiation factor 5A